MEYLIHLVERLGHWGYLVVFLIILLECQALIGLFMPGETLVLAGGFLASQGSLDLDGLILTISGAAIFGDSLGYELGRHLGKDWLLRHGRWAGMSRERLGKIDAFFARHGGKSAFFAHFLHFLRSTVPFVAGASRMPYRTFFLANSLGCVLWAGIFTTVGYLLGASWKSAEKWIGRGSVVLGLLLLLVGLFVWLSHWIVGHEAAIRERAGAIWQHPRVVTGRIRLAPQLAWLQRRFSTRGALGLHLTAGAFILIAAGWLFGGITEDVLHGDPLTVVDAQVAAFFHAHAAPWLTRIMFAISFVASTAFITTSTVLLTLFFVVRHRWHHLLALLLVVPGGALLNLLIKHLIHRQRPVFENALVTLDSYSFPSGHTMAATLFYGLMAFFFGLSVRGWRDKTLAGGMAGLIVSLVAFSRVCLGAHYLSDVLGAIAVGLAWLSVCLTAVETFRRSGRATAL